MCFRIKDQEHLLGHLSDHNEEEMDAWDSRDVEGLFSTLY